MALDKFVKIGAKLDVAESTRLIQSDLDKISASLSTATIKGNTGFTNLTNNISKTSSAIKSASVETKVWSDELGKNAVKMFQWGVLGAGIWGTFRKIREGVEYIMELDNAMNEIRIVTNMTQGEVNKLAMSYNDLAKSMSVTTTEIAKTSVELFRQGLTAEQVNERMIAIIKYAKISGLELAESNKIITATANSTGESVNKIVDLMAYLGKQHCPAA